MISTYNRVLDGQISFCFPKRYFILPNNLLNLYVCSLNIRVLFGFFELRRGKRADKILFIKNATIRGRYKHRKDAKNAYCSPKMYFPFNLERDSLVSYHERKTTFNSMIQLVYHQHNVGGKLNLTRIVLFNVSSLFQKISPDAHISTHRKLSPSSCYFVS